MRESTGGAILMGLAAAIILIFIIMVAFFISYGTSFKLKNSIINRIEQNEGLSKDEIVTFLNGKTNKYNGKTVAACYNTINDSENELRGFTVNIIVYVEMDKNIFDIPIKIPIKGETRLIEKGEYLKELKSLELKECDNNVDINNFVITN